MDLDAAISTFFRRWDALERSVEGGGLVLDFDMAPRVPWNGDPYADRDEAVRVLDGLLDRVAGTDSLIDPELVQTKLRGSDAYLRALNGEVAPFETYLHATMGIAPDPLDSSTLDALRQQVLTRFESHDVPFGTEGRSRLGHLFGRATSDEVARDLPILAEQFVARVRALLPELPEPDYSIEVVDTDAYWANWIDGSVEGGVALKINTHERIEYERRSARGLAAHEIAGHAVHVAGMRHAAATGTLDPCALNLTVHSCEAFHMEGLAQIALYALSAPDELDEGDALRLEHRLYSGAVLNRAQMRIEDGMSVDEAADEAVAACPLVKPLTIRASLRDRARDPLYRCYIHVYAPALRTFLRFRELDEPARSTFLRQAWTSLKTPTQLRALLA
ncbi:MAG: hypothetical protein ACI9K2_003334 [Myxococcota bacterium]|jgi:hypothetical protein